MRDYSDTNLQLVATRRAMTSRDERPTPKRQKLQQRGNGPRIQPTMFEVGDLVFARYYGDTVLKITGIANMSGPGVYYICEADGKKHIIPKIQLSTKSLVSETGDGNRKQLHLSI
jgi:hypothetical protein